MSRFFQKELPDAALWIGGRPLRFDIMETDDPALIAEFENCIRRHQGGIIEISAERYAEELKKKEQENSSGGSLRPRQRQELSAFQLGNPGAAAASRFARPQLPQLEPQRESVQHPMPDPVEVPSPASFQLPPVAKLKDLKAMAERAKPK